MTMHQTVSLPVRLPVAAFVNGRLNLTREPTGGSPSNNGYEHGGSDVDDDVRLLTYDELAVALGIARESARQLVIRKRWHRSKGNDGKARIHVPVEALEHHPTAQVTSSRPSDKACDDEGLETSPEAASTGDDPSVVAAAITALTRHIERLEREIAEAAAERSAERAQATEQINALREIIEAEQQRHEAAMQRLEDAWREQANAAQRALAEQAQRRGLRSWLRRRA